MFVFLVRMCEREKGDNSRTCMLISTMVELVESLKIYYFVVGLGMSFVRPSLVLTTVLLQFLFTFNSSDCQCVWSQQKPRCPLLVQLCFHSAVPFFAIQRKKMHPIWLLCTLCFWCALLIHPFGGFSLNISPSIEVKYYSIFPFLWFTIKTEPAKWYENCVLYISYVYKIEACHLLSSLIFALFTFPLHHTVHNWNGAIPFNRCSIESE